jgi:hypothetical protein
MVEEVKGSALVVLSDGVPTRLYPGRDSTIFGTPSWTTVECLPEQYLKRWYKLPLSGAEDSHNKLLESVATRASVIMELWRSCNTNKINKIGAALTELLLAFGHEGKTTSIVGKADKANGMHDFTFRFAYSTDTFLNQRSMQCMARIEVDAKSQTLRITIKGGGASAMPGFEMFIGTAYMELSARVSPES